MSLGVAEVGHCFPRAPGSLGKHEVGYVATYCLQPVCSTSQLGPSGLPHEGEENSNPSRREQLARCGERRDDDLVERACSKLELGSSSAQTAWRGTSPSSPGPHPPALA